MKLNLACGEVKIDGCINVDIGEVCKPDKLLNLFEPEWWREFGEEQAEEIYVFHFLEHIPHDIRGREGVYVFMENCYKVAKNGCIMSVKFPHWLHEMAYSDPTHTRTLTPATMQYFNAEWRSRWGFKHYKVECDWGDAVITKAMFDKEESHWPTTAARRHSIMHEANVIHEVHMQMRAYKPMRVGT